MDRKSFYVYLGVLIGFLGGMLFGITAKTPSSSTAKIFREENKPAIIRTYEPLRSDRIYI